MKKSLTTIERPVIEDLTLAPPKVEEFPEYPPVAKLLYESAEYLSKPRHWIKNSANNLHGGFCAVGVISEFSRNTDEEYEAQNFLIRELPEGRDIPAYNDRSTTRKKDIIALFQRAFQRALTAGK